MYARLRTRGIMDGNPLDWICNVRFHQGRTDNNGGHRDWLNRMGNGIGSYHYHHGLFAHLHPNGVCPYGYKRTFIINPYTGKKISLGQPYFMRHNEGNVSNTEYYSLNLVSKALTIFSYPTIFSIRQDNTLFKTNNDRLELLCHTQKAALDDVECYAYISLETVAEYMTEGSYFTDFYDNGTGVWRFKLFSEMYKPSVEITAPKSGNIYVVGDILRLKADISNASYADITIGRHNDFIYDLENKTTVVYDYEITESDVGDLAVSVKVFSDIVPDTADSRVDIYVEGSEKGREIIIPETIKGKLNGEEKILYPVENWGGPGKGGYEEGVQKDNEGRYKVAVAPKIVNPSYPDTGRIWDDYDGLYKGIRLDVVLRKKGSEELKTIECVVDDYKAHSYNKYRDGHEFDTGDKAYFDVENGLIQTGIAYPRSWNASQNMACSPEHMNGTVIEFCGHEVDFICSDYELVKVIVIEE